MITNESYVDTYDLSKLSEKRRFDADLHFIESINILLKEEGYSRLRTKVKVTYNGTEVYVYK